MEEVATYLLKSSICTAMFLGVYGCFFRNETFYVFNRYFLLAGMVCSTMLPFYTYTYTVKVITSTAFVEGNHAVGEGADNESVWIYAVLFTYAGGVGFLLIRHITGLLRIKRIISKYDYIPMQGGKLVMTSAFKSCFSVFHYIIIDPTSGTSDLERKLVIEHELAHVKQFHWVDLLIAQMFCTMNWVNPLAWLYLHAIKQNHEFLADLAVLQKGNPVGIYRAVLINHSIGTSVFTFSSSFLQYDRLKRVHMMARPASASFNKFAVLITLPALALFLWAFSKSEYEIEPTNTTINTGNINEIIQDRFPMMDTLHKLNIAGLEKIQGSTTENGKPVNTISAAQKLPDKEIVTSASDSLLYQHDKKAERDRLVVPAKNPSKLDDQSKLEIKGKLPPLMILDGKEISSMNIIQPEDIESMHVIKDKFALATYGEKGKYGVVLIFSKKIVAP